MRLRRVIVPLLILLVFSCGCLQGGGSECNDPYILHGNGCCLDENANSICDQDEVVESTSLDTLKAVSTTKIPASTSTMPSVEATTTSITAYTSTIPATTSTIKNKLVESCADDYGVKSSTVIYLYTSKCCDPIVSDRVRAVERKGFAFEWINLVGMSPAEKLVLDCFVSGDVEVPQFICPATKESMVLLDSAGMQARINGFAQECNESAWK